MKVVVTGFCGVNHVEFSFDKIVLLCGKNAVGKSSTALAIAAIASGEMIPVAGVKRSDGRVFVHLQSQSARASLAGDGWEVIGTWPESKLISTGTPLTCHPVASGLDRLSMHASVRDRAAWMEKYVRSAPAKSDLDAQLKGLDINIIAQVWADIELNNNWDVVHGKYSDLGRTAKATWQAITGEAYGAKKAAAWTPEGWSVDTAMSAEQAESLVHTARRNLETAIGAGAVKSDEKAKLQPLVASGKANTTEAEAALATLREELPRVKESRAKMPPASSTMAHDCPHCGGKVSISPIHNGGYSLAKLDGVAISKDEINSRLKAIADADGKIGFLEQKIRSLTDQIAAGQAKNRQIDAAIARLNELDKMPEQDQSAVEKARQEVAAAEETLSGIERISAASEQHRQIVTLSKIVKALAPDGVRAYAMSKAMERLNKALAEYSGIAGWGAVEVGHEFVPNYTNSSGSKIPYTLLSQSEKFRVDVTIQALVSKASSCGLMLVDGFDVLDSQGRAGFFKLLKHVAIPTIVCMTVANAEKYPPPDLGKMGLGKTIWLDNGSSRTESEAA
ncbi:MAG: hypothetical protein HQL74_13180 [Magnetococcales bacterium]|nr:hypothetical protein [Magnetococcales bacterium]